MIMAWTGAHSAFTVLLETFFKTGKSVIDTQSVFRAHFMLRRNDSVPDRIFNPYYNRYSIRNSIITM